MAQRKPPAKNREVVTLADLAPRHRVIGGTVFGADPIARRQEAPKAAAKDLPGKSSKVKGGGRDLNDNMTLVRVARPAKNICWG